MKQCKKCNKNLPLSAFRKHLTNRDRLTGKCEECLRLERKDREEKNRKPDVTGHKRCKRCNSNLHKTSFIKNKSSKDGLNGWCRECSKDDALQNKYGISLRDYNDLLEKQNQTCAICGTDTPGGRRNSFVVDHCHETGKVRGLLCNHCNTGIGKLRDSIELLEKAIEYLKSKRPD